MNDILAAREREIANLQEMMKEDNVYLTLKANVPGEVKRTDISAFLINLMRQRIYSTFSVKDERFYDDFDGFYYIFEIEEKNRLEVKLTAISLEEADAIGRYIDIDVFQNETKSLSRRDLNIKSRKCFICDENPYICIRSKAHTLEEIKNKMYNDIIDFLEAEVTKIIDESISLELALDPKFGLVTSKTSGSHKDMNYCLMMISKEIITPYLSLMLISGFCNQIDNITEAIKKIGLTAEEKMLKTTDNINTYKGLIFSLGYVASAFGYLLKNNLVFDKLYETVEYLGKDLEKEFLNNLNTFGAFAYKEYGFLGARGEIIKGLPVVREALKVLESYPDFSDEALIMTLIKIISLADDTVLLKRAGSIEKYNYYKNRVANIKNYSIIKIKEVTDECISQKISFGGSSDLLAVVIFIAKMRKKFFYGK
ncbi:MAG: triphosphoribosyl-dephospho-CoA synthase [Bacilli bacterium]|nr:triphosphoribosyl-dephospho-CoA synthase [Bacilli bacterium]